MHPIQWKRIAALALMLLTALYLVGCAPSAPAAAAPEAAEPAATEAPVQSVSASETESSAESAVVADSGAYDGITFTANDLNGKKITETYIRNNKVTVVNFWATWCPPCVGEIPEFSEVAKAYKSKDCAFLGVQLDEDADAAKALWEKHAVSYPSVLPDGGLADIGMRLSAIPVTMLFDGDGKPIGDMHIGALDKGSLTVLIDAALKAQ